MVNGVDSSNAAEDAIARQQEAARAAEIARQSRNDIAAVRDNLTNNNTENLVGQSKQPEQLAGGPAANTFFSNVQSLRDQAAAAAGDLQTLNNIRQAATAPIPNADLINPNTKLSAYNVPGTLKASATVQATPTSQGGTHYFKDTNNNQKADPGEERYFRANSGQLYKGDGSKSAWQRVQTKQQNQLTQTLKDRYDVATGAKYDRAQDPTKDGAATGHYLTAAGSSGDPSKRYFFDSATQKLYQRDTAPIAKVDASSSPAQKQQLAKDLSDVYKKDLTYLGVQPIPYRDSNGMAKPADAKDEHILQAKNGEKYIWNPDSRTLRNQQGKAETPQLYDFGKSDKWKEMPGPHLPGGTAALMMAAKEDKEREAKAQERVKQEEQTRVENLQGLKPDDVKNLAQDRKDANSARRQIEYLNRQYLGGERAKENESKDLDERNDKTAKLLEKQKNDPTSLTDDEKNHLKKENESNGWSRDIKKLKNDLADLDKRNDKTAELLKKQLNDPKSLTDDEKNHLKETQERWSNEPDFKDRRNLQRDKRNEENAREVLNRQQRNELPRAEYLEKLRIARADEEAKYAQKVLMDPKADPEWKARSQERAIETREDAEQATNEIKKIKEDIEKQKTHVAYLETRNKTTAELLHKQKSAPTTLKTAELEHLKTTQDRWKARDQVDQEEKQAEQKEREEIGKLIFKQGAKVVELNKEEQDRFNKIEIAADRLNHLLNNPPNLNYDPKTATEQEKKDAQIYKRAFGDTSRYSSEERKDFFRRDYAQYQEIKKSSDGKMTELRINAILYTPLFDHYLRMHNGHVLDINSYKSNNNPPSV